MANNPPPFIPPDLRVSPSGPYIDGPNLGGAIVRMGCDVVVGDGDDPSIVELGIDEGDPTIINVFPRSQGPDVPLAVEFLEWESTDLLWVAWHLTAVGLSVEGEGPANTGIQFQVQPIVDVGAGFALIDPSGVGGFNPLTLVGGTVSDPINLSGHACIPITDPAQPPIVQLAFLLGRDGEDEIEVTVFGGPLGTTGPSASSSWLLALELDSARVFQTPPEVVFSPFAVSP